MLTQHNLSIYLSIPLCPLPLSLKHTGCFLPYYAHGGQCTFRTWTGVSTLAVLPRPRLEAVITERASERERETPIIALLLVFRTLKGVA